MNLFRPLTPQALALRYRAENTLATDGARTQEGAVHTRSWLAGGIKPSVVLSPSGDYNPTMQKSVRIDFDEHWQLQRFLALKGDCRKRIGTDELTHAAFAKMLLDVWEHHLESNPGELGVSITIEESGGVAASEIVRDTGVKTNGQ